MKTELLAIIVLLHVIVFVAVVKYICSLKYCFPYVGLGGYFVFDTKTKTLWVASRLLDSPLGRAGIPNGVCVLSINGSTAVGASYETVLSLLKQNKSLRLEYTDTQGNARSAILAKTLLVRKCPAYFATCSNGRRVDGDHQTLEWCPLTGQYIFGGKVSSRGLGEVYFA